MNVRVIEEIKDGARDRAPVLAVRFGRGRTGGTTFLDFLVQRARRAGRAVMIADGDPKKGLANLYPPDSPERRDPAARDRYSRRHGMGDRSHERNGECAIVDGSRHGGWRQSSVRAFEGHGLAGVLRIGPSEDLPIYSLGPDSEDFDEVMNVFEAGYFRSERLLVVLNESLIKTGKGAGGAFDFIMSDPRFPGLVGSGSPVTMPRLACMDAMRNEGLTFYEAADGKRGKSGRPMSLGHQFMVRTWINRMEKELTPVEDWLP